MPEQESLFLDAREALDVLANDAASTASEQGIDTVSSFDDDVRKALDAGETLASIAREVVARLDKWGAPFPVATSIDKFRKVLADDE